MSARPRSKSQARIPVGRELVVHPSSTGNPVSRVIAKTWPPLTRLWSVRVRTGWRRPSLWPERADARRRVRGAGPDWRRLPIGGADACRDSFMTSARPCIRWPWHRRSSGPFRSRNMASSGFEPPAMLAHPFDGGTPAAIAKRSLADTAAKLGLDEGAYRRLIGSVASAWPLLDRRCGPRATAPAAASRLPLGRFGLSAMQPAAASRRAQFSRRTCARRCLPGIAGPRDAAARGNADRRIGLVLQAMTHTAGWPFPRGGVAAARRCAGCPTCDRLAERS